MPLRKCVICREMLPKETLVRIVKNSDKALTVDENGKAQCRGYYICKKESCLKKCVDKKLLRKFVPKSYGEITEDKDAYKELEKIINDRKN